MEITNHKTQITNKFQLPKLSALRLDSPPCGRVPSFKIPNNHIILKKENSKYVWVIEYWNLRFICNLVLGI